MKMNEQLRAMYERAIAAEAKVRTLKAKLAEQEIQADLGRAIVGNAIAFVQADQRQEAAVAEMSALSSLVKRYLLELQARQAVAAEAS